MSPTSATGRTAWGGVTDPSRRRTENHADLVGVVAEHVIDLASGQRRPSGNSERISSATSSSGADRGRRPHELSDHFVLRADHVQHVRAA